MTKKQIFCLILAFLVGLGLANFVLAQTRIDGPDQTRTGALAVFEIMPAQVADWNITPTSGTEDSFQVDSATDKLYFASPKSGTYHLVAAIIVDGKPQLMTHAFVNQGDNEIKPPPGPIPSPIPEPEQPLTTWIKTELPKLVKSQNLVQEQKLVAQCFRETVQKIETGTIQTAQNARSQLQITLTMSLAFASESAIDDWQPFLNELSRKMADELGGNVNDLIAVKTVFEDVAKALNEPVVVHATSKSTDVDCPTCQPQPSTGRWIFPRIRR